VATAVRMILVPDSVEVVQHCVGIEVRAIMELHALPQVEGPLQSVLGDLPALGQRRLHPG